MTLKIIGAKNKMFWANETYFGVKNYVVMKNGRVGNALCQYE